jgi:hypothetical protein
MRGGIGRGCCLILRRCVLCFDSRGHADDMAIEFEVYSPE